jgi:hypothetical protein
MKAVFLGALCIAALQQLPANASMVPVKWRDGRLVDFLDRTLYTPSVTSLRAATLATTAASRSGRRSTRGSTR